MFDLEFHNIFIITFILFMLYMYYENYNTDVGYVISSFDNRKYLVRNMPDNDESAVLLSRIRHNLESLCEKLKKTNASDERVQRLIYKFNPSVISETDGNSKYTSYSVNKGEKIVLCMRTRDEEEKLHDLNTMMFVSLHELAHVMTKSVGHTPEFWKNFKYLLKEAMKMNIYQFEDYNKNPKKYCGIEITDTPLTDDSI